MKILIAEDDMISRNLLRKTLKQFGHEVTAFDNGADAWAEYDANPTE